jgi:acyl-[acyl-carrier-protein]-phospholipid O-acyltransferase/long-chain-fatty-acid--[acyl-carrier-protein] ligase
MNKENVPDSDSAILRHARGQFACIASAYSLGTFNDNLYKQATMLLAVLAGRTDTQSYVVMVFTLPFLLFAAPAGWCADRFPKRRVIIVAKWLELLAMLFGAVGVCTGQNSLIFTMLFIMGVQATIFSPSMNGALPELYPPRFVPHANGILRMFVTVAILGGMATAGFLLSHKGVGWYGISAGRLLVAGTVVGIALMGLLVSYGVPRRPAANPHNAFPWDGPVRTLKDLWSTRHDPLLAIAIATNVFVWSAGSIGILILNPMGLNQFHMGELLTSCLGVSELVGIALGGILSARLVKLDHWYRVVGPSCAGMGLAMLGMLGVPFLPAGGQPFALYGLTFFLGAMGGAVLIPMESFLQVRPAPARKGAILSSVNFIVFGGVLVSGGVAKYLNQWFKPTEAFAVMGLCSLLISAVLYTLFRREEKRTHNL